MPASPWPMANRWRSSLSKASSHSTSIVVMVILPRSAEDEPGASHGVGINCRVTQIPVGPAHVPPRLNFRARQARSATVGVHPARDQDPAHPWTSQSSCCALPLSLRCPLPRSSRSVPPKAQHLPEQAGRRVERTWRNERWMLRLSFGSMKSAVATCGSPRDVEAAEDSCGVEAQPAEARASAAMRTRTAMTTDGSGLGIRHA
ncbi:hypothetical protein EDF77_2854 [Stenotrophomonas maltophilia]|nr:hypothetical protein [Stenotrophomonas chelatiphaga]ROQ39032.1 hypothetical protein EDF77_2854 [Stenotrophomonas maltophilia]